LKKQTGARKMKSAKSWKQTHSTTQTNLVRVIRIMFIPTRRKSSTVDMSYQPNRVRIQKPYGIVSCCRKAVSPKFVWSIAKHYFSSKCTMFVKHCW
jgi:hypothetical protein